MNHRYYSEQWFFYGISDLYFSFHSDEWVFDYYQAFFSIMGLEKHLKAFLVFKRQDEYKQLDDNKAERKALEIAKSYNHNFKKMVSKANSYFKDKALDNLLIQDHDGYKGEELISILSKAYMETRYPTMEFVSENFPLQEKGAFHNPLSSSGLHKFISRTCEALILDLEDEIDFANILENIENRFGHLEPFSRFKNLYLSKQW